MSDKFPVDDVAEPLFGLMLGPRLVSVHGQEECAGRFCVVHNPSDNHMREWPLVWRADKRTMERRCPHGVGHPDVDDLAWHVSQGREWVGVHGCCASHCCHA